MVDEDAGELVTDGSLHQRGGHGGVDAAGKRADDPSIPHLFPNPGHLLVDDVGGRPVGTAPCDVAEEVLQDVLAGLAVVHLGVPLHTDEFAVQVLEGSHRGPSGAGQHLEALGGAGHRVAVTHPHIDAVRNLGEQTSGVVDGQTGASVLGGSGVGHLAAEPLGHELEAVADAHHRHSGREEGSIHARGVVGVHRGRSAGEDHRCGVLGEHVVHRHGVRDDLGVHRRLTNASGDELGVLGAVVDDEHEVVGLFHIANCMG